MLKRPKIKLKLTATDKVWEIIGWLALTIIWIFTMTNYSRLPNTIPVHFNGAGKADGYGGKSSIFTLPSVATVLFMGMTIINKFPHLFNYLTDITADNAFSQYTNATRMIRYLKVIIVFIFGLISFKTIQSATGQSEGLGVWFLPLVLGLTFMPIAYFVVRSSRTIK